MKKIIALISAAALLLSLAACDGQTEKEKTTVAEQTTVESVNAETTKADGETTTEEPSVTEPTVENEETTAEKTTAVKKTTAKKTTAKKTTTKKKATTVKKTTTKKKTTTAKKPTTKKTEKAPSTTAEIVSFFNSATKLVATKKPGFSKTSTVTLTKMEPAVLAKISVVKNVVEDFVGVGTKNETAKKGSDNSKLFRASTLSASDVSKATCTSSGNNYIITLTVKGGTNPEKGSSPIGRLTNDYKSRSEIKKGLAEGIASDKNFKSCGDVKETMNSATAKITVNKTTKQISSYSITYTYNAVIKDVKYTIVTATADVDAKGSINFSSFVW